MTKLTEGDHKSLGKAIGDVIEKLFNTSTVDTAEEVVAETVDLIEIADGAQAPWVIEAYKYEHFNEVDERAELEALMGINPDDSDGGVAWCAYFINSIMEKCGIKGTGSGMANSFANWGTECECRDGAIAVWEGHVGICMGDGVFGGNQGDQVRLNKNRAWFDKNKKLLGYRCPPGYTFV